MAHGVEPSWAVSTSESSDSSGDSDGVAAAMALGRGRGRPRKYPVGSTRTQRRRLLEAARELELTGEVAPPGPAQPTAFHTSAGVMLPSLSHIRAVGDSHSVMVGQILQRAGSESKQDVRSIADNALINDLVDTYLVQTSSAPSCSVVAKQMKVTAKTVKTKLKTMAAAVFHGARALVASVVSKVLLDQQNDDLKVIGCFQNILYDETPLPIHILRSMLSKNWILKAKLN